MTEGHGAVVLGGTETGHREHREPAQCQDHRPDEVKGGADGRDTEPERTTGTGAHRCRA